MTYDALVVGSGPNGLAAAITLAERGRSVLVLEANDTPGGAVATAELTLPGFHHDTFSAVYPAAAASPVFARMQLERHGLRWVQPPYCYAHPLPDGRAVVLARSLDETAASLDALHPGDGERWRAFAGPFVQRFGAVRRTMLSGFPPLRGPAQMVAQLGPRRFVDFVRLLFMPATGLGSELFRSSGARAWLYSSAMHGDVAPHATGSAIAAAYLNFAGHAVGWPSPEGGADRLAQALVGRLRELGGDVRTSARVVRVRTEGRRVRGVELEGGETLDAPTVIADVVPGALVALAGDALPRRYADALRRYRHGPATVKVDWALSAPIPWEAPELHRAGHRARRRGRGRAPRLARARQERQGGRAPVPAGRAAEPVRPDARAGGMHTAWAYTHGPHGVDWEAETPRMVERMEAQVERFAPGFRDRILGRHVLSPADLERRDANLVGGDVGAGSYSLDQVLFRPTPSVSPYRTPVRGLYIGSAATFPGGAVHGVPGHAAARVALAEGRLRR